MPDQVDNHEPIPSADAKPRLKWTQQLHERFVDAVSQLGGADKATPKSLMRVMGIPRITLYHLKSHLQKYRLSKCRVHKPNYTSEDAVAADFRPSENIIVSNDSYDKAQNSRCMLQLQMEVQMRLQEQMEVQKHLQLRIEAQGKYLQSVLRKAQETLAVNYRLNPHCELEAEVAKAELSALVSEVDNECQSSPTFSQAASVRKKHVSYADCSADSCLTFSELADLKNNMSECTNDSTAESDEPSSYNHRRVKTEGSQGEERISYVYQMKEECVVSREEIDLNR